MRTTIRVFFFYKTKGNIKTNYVSKMKWQTSNDCKLTKKRISRDDCTEKVFCKTRLVFVPLETTRNLINRKYEYTGNNSYDNHTYSIAETVFERTYTGHWTFRVIGKSRGIRDEMKRNRRRSLSIRWQLRIVSVVYTEMILIDRTFRFFAP